MLNQPYVYALVDPRDGKAFYIGKGNKRRMFQHQRDTQRGKVQNAAKTAKIKEILASGLEVQCTQLAFFATDAEACTEEIRLIAATEGLTNIRPGGEGAKTGVIPLRMARELLGRVKPYMEWINERPRTNQESDWYHQIVAELKEIILFCTKPSGKRHSQAA